MQIGILVGEPLPLSLGPHHERVHGPPDPVLCCCCRARVMVVLAELAELCLRVRVRQREVGVARVQVRLHLMLLLLLLLGVAVRRPELVAVERRGVVTMLKLRVLVTRWRQRDHHLIVIVLRYWRLRAHLRLLHLGRLAVVQTRTGAQLDLAALVAGRVHVHERHHEPRRMDYVIQQLSIIPIDWDGICYLLFVLVCSVLSCGGCCSSSLLLAHLVC